MYSLLGIGIVHILEMVLLATAVRPHRLTAWKVKKKAELRVYQGVDDVTPKYPYVVVIKHLQGSRFCTGTLIAPEWVLTAAHCFKSGFVPSYIQYGKLSIPLNMTDSKSEAIRIVRHPQYDNRRGLINDIALLRVSPGVSMDKYGILSAVDYSALMGLSVEYVGGGRTHLYEMKTDDQLRPLQLGQGVVSPCILSSFRGLVCVAPRCSFKQQVLPGDSGGPLLVYNKIVGVANSCVNIKKYHVANFVPTSPYLEWIYSVITSTPNQLQLDSKISNSDV